MPKQTTTAPLIKGYLPVRVNFPSDDGDDPKDVDETFFYVKEHFGADKNTIFVANAPFYPNITTSTLLRSLLGRFGDIERIAVVPNPRKEKDDMSSLLWTTKKNLYPSIHGPNVCEGKFAQVSFESQKEMKKALKSLQDVMNDEVDDEDEYPGLIIDKLEIQTLQDETQRKLSGDDSDDEDDNMTSKKPLSGILAVADRYRQSLEAISSRQDLLDECNKVMQDYEEAEEEDRTSREVAKNEPDDDGFVTVTYSAQNVGSKRELEEGVTTTNRRKGGSKRARKKKDVNGSSELQDFYRFQQKEGRKKTVQELRKKFEEDLQKVKKMKEERQYRPFS